MSQIDPVSNCARVLFTTTKNWQSGDGVASTLADARSMLAQVVYALNGEGFPAPASDQAVKQDSLQEVWKACAVAARTVRPDQGKPRDPAALHVVFWVADSTNPGKLTDQAGLGLNWPYQPDSHVTRVSGAILDGSDPRPKRLFFFDKIAEDAAVDMDANASSGFWPHSNEATTPALVSLLPSRSTPRQGHRCHATPSPGDLSVRILDGERNNFGGLDLAPRQHDRKRGAQPGFREHHAKLSQRRNTVDRRLQPEMVCRIGGSNRGPSRQGDPS
jgi:hypothetical protein